MELLSSLFTSKKNIILFSYENRSWDLDKFILSSLEMYNVFLTNFNAYSSAYYFNTNINDIHQQFFYKLNLEQIGLEKPIFMENYNLGLITKFNPINYIEFSLLNTINIAFDSRLVEESDLIFGNLRLLEVDNRLVLPTGVFIRILITSYDVLHS